MSNNEEEAELIFDAEQLIQQQQQQNDGEGDEADITTPTTTTTTNNNHQLDDYPMVEDGDELVKEIDVYFNQSLSKNIFLLQYPLRPKWQPYDQSTLSQVKFKPKGLKMEMNFNVDTSSDMYDDQNLTGYKKFSLSSSSVPLKSTFAVGVLRSDGLYLTPMHSPDCSVLQLRPSFAHLAVPKADLTESKDNNEEEEVVDAEDEFKPLQVQFKTKENERAAAARQKTHAYLKQLEEEEQWVELEFHDKNDPEIYDIFDALTTKPEHVDSIKRLNKDVYLSNLLPSRENQIPALASPPTSPYYASLDELRKFPVPNQVEALLRTASVMKFDRLASLVTNARDEIEIIVSLQNVGVLVQNCWVVKSQFCCGNNARLVAIRDYLLFLFATERYVNKKEFAEQAKLDLSTAQEMLKPLSILRFRKGRSVWEFKYPADMNFCDRYPNIVTQYDDFWIGLKDQIIQKMDAANEEFLKFVPQPMQVEPERRVIERRPEKVPVRREVNRENLGPEEEIRKHLFELFKKLNVCTQKNIEDHFNELQASKKLFNELNLGLVFEVLNSIAGNMRKGYYLLSVGDATLDKYRNVVLGVFNEKGSLQKKDVIAAVQRELGEESIPSGAYTKIVKELGIANKKGVWTWKTELV